jgi:transcriptional regulator with XRE-family HTH domain
MEIENDIEEVKKMIGRRIKELRKENLITQKELAEKIGIETKYLSAVEVGRSSPSMATLTQLASNLNVRVKDIFIYDDLSEIENIRKKIIIQIRSAEADQVIKFDKLTQIVFG